MSNQPGGIAAFKTLNENQKVTMIKLTLEQMASTMAEETPMLSFILGEAVDRITSISGETTG